ncbi:hypothetical protein FPV67DRAFT_1461993 [Lyophyllum atratum]|nr:hypothetical protein FPV67DRAFT_1461993 [Lyophyllum atratum]
MATGFEAAGLALAIFPLLVQGLGVYLDGCTRFLDGMLFAKEVKRLMTGNAWGDPELQHKLRQRMGDKAAETFTELVEELLASLEQLKQDLGVPAEFAKVNRRTWKRIRLVLQKEEALADISKTVRQIERLASEKISTFLKPSRQNAQIYSRFRKDAIDLHNTLLESFCAQQSCSCSAPHNANLRLQRMSKQKSNIAGPRFSVLLTYTIHDFRFDPGVEEAPGETARHHARTREDSIPLHLISTEEQKRFTGASDAGLISASTQPQKAISFDKSASSAAPQATSQIQGEQSRQAVSFAMDTSPKAMIRNSEGAKEIKDLCSVIANAYEKPTELGVLGTVKGWLIRAPSSWFCESYNPEVVSLNQLLQRGNLRKADRLRLGVQLASSLMHLHATDWLNESWGKRDILFPQTAVRAWQSSGAEILILEADLEKPPQPPSGGHKKVPFLPYDKNLFSLGIVFIELWFGSRLQDLAEHQSAKPHDNTDSSDWEKANWLFSIIEQQTGKIYGDAVRRCIGGLDYSATTLHDDGSKREVDMKVVSELERNW